MTFKSVQNRDTILALKPSGLRSGTGPSVRFPAHPRQFEFRHFSYSTEDGQRPGSEAK